MKNILLIAPSGDSKLEQRLLPPLGLLYIATILDMEKYAKVKIIDSFNNNYSDEEIIDMATLFSPDIIGISINFFLTMKTGIRLMKKLKQQFPDTIIISGGNAATYSAKFLLEKGFDYISLHEGENTFKDIALCSTRDLKEIKGVAFMNPNFYSTSRSVINNLDELPFPNYTLLEKYQNYNVFLSSSRGCPYNCFYCSTKQMWGIKFRKRSAESIYMELKYLEKIFAKDNTLAVSFCDDNFLVDKKRFFCLSNLIENDTLKLKLGFSARIELMTDEIIKKASKIGVHSIFFGIESGSSATLQRLRRNYSKEDVLKTVEKCQDHGIEVTTSFMVGIPGENYDDLKETFSLIRALPNKNIQVHVCTALPGTDMWNNPTKYGIIGSIDHNNLGDIDSCASFDTEYFSREEINKTYMEAIALLACKKRGGDNT